MTYFYLHNEAGVGLFPLSSRVRFLLFHAAGSRQVDIFVGDVSLHIGLPMERPNYRASADRVRVGFGPFAVSWWRR